MLTAMPGPARHQSLRVGEFVLPDIVVGALVQATVVAAKRIARTLAEQIDIDEGAIDRLHQLRRLLARELQQALFQRIAQPCDVLDLDDLLECVHPGQLGALDDELV